MIDPERLLAHTPAVGLGRRVHRHQVAVLAYHGIPDAGAFRRQLRAIASRHSFISPDDLRSWLAGGELPPYPVLVSFDDGDRSIIERGAAVLEELSIPSLLFVVAGLLDSDTPFWWDEVAASSDGGVEEVRRLKGLDNDQRVGILQSLRAQAELNGTAKRTPQLTTADLRSLESIGAEIGNHSFDHPCLDRCESAEAARQIEHAHAALEDRGFSPTAFAYPNGNLDTRVEPTLSSLGYDLGFLFDHRHTNRHGDHMRISRLRLDAAAPPERALGILSGVHGAVMRLRRRG